MVRKIRMTGPLSQTAIFGSPVPSLPPMKNIEAVTENAKLGFLWIQQIPPRIFPRAFCLVFLQFPFDPVPSHSTVFRVDIDQHRFPTQGIRYEPGCSTTIKEIEHSTRNSGSITRTGRRRLLPLSTAFRATSPLGSTGHDRRFDQGFRKRSEMPDVR